MTLESDKRTTEEKLSTFRDYCQFNVDFWQSMLAVSNTPAELKGWLEAHTAYNGLVVSPWDVYTPIDSDWPEFCPECEVK